MRVLIFSIAITPLLSVVGARLCLPPEPKQQKPDNQAHDD
jgi:hypothetical protein